MSLALEDERIIRDVHISPGIGIFSAESDMIFLTLCRVGTNWYPLNVISIGSILGTAGEQGHMTLNPRLMKKLPQSLARKMRTANDVF